MPRNLSTTSNTARRGAPVARAACRAALGLLLAAGSAFAAPAVRLGELLDIARASDAQYAAVRSSAQAGRERLPQARAAIRPSINLSDAMRRKRDGSTAFDDMAGWKGWLRAPPPA